MYVQLFFLLYVYGDWLSMYVVEFFWINDFNCVVNYFNVVIFFEFSEYVDDIFFGGFYDVCQVIV